LLVKAGVGPTLSAGIVTATGGAGAYLLRGYAKSASIGVAASGAGQLALTLMARKPAQVQGRTLQTNRRRNELPAPGCLRRNGRSAARDRSAAVHSSAYAQRPARRSLLARKHNAHQILDLTTKGERE